LIEVWRKEFENIMREIYPHRSLETSDGKMAYEDRDVFYWFTGFLMAKRSMPVIELPDIYYEAGEDMAGSYFVEDIHAALESSGIQYRVKEKS